MHITKSPLELISIFLIDANYEYMPVVDGEVDTDTWFNLYDLDLDFTYFPEEDSEDETWVYARTAINFVKDPLPGYQLFVEATGHFRFPPEQKLTQEQKVTLLNTSALSMVINYLRAAIIQLTSQGPYGPYVLPSIDIAELHKQKLENMQQRAGRVDRKKSSRRKAADPEQDSE